MYTHGMEFLEDERDAWEPYEALADVPDEAMDRPTDRDGPGHGWSARTLIAHMLGWHETVLKVALELAVNETSPTYEAVSRDWDERADAMNEDIHARYADTPPEELRKRLRELPGELRGTLTVVPEARWLKHPRHSEVFVEWMLEHEADHRKELDAVLANVRGDA
jgi:hypothetical protein